MIFALALPLVAAALRITGLGASQSQLRAGRDHLGEMTDFGEVLAPAGFRYRLAGRLSLCLGLERDDRGSGSGDE